MKMTGLYYCRQSDQHDFVPEKFKNILPENKQIVIILSLNNPFRALCNFISTGTFELSPAARYPAVLIVQCVSVYG